MTLDERPALERQEKANSIELHCLAISCPWSNEDALSSQLSDGYCLKDSKRQCLSTCDSKNKELVRTLSLPHMAQWAPHSKRQDAAVNLFRLV